MPHDKMHDMRRSTHTATYRKNVAAEKYRVKKRLEKMESDRCSGLEVDVDGAKKRKLTLRLQELEELKPKERSDKGKVRPRDTEHRGYYSLKRRYNRLICNSGESGDCKKSKMHASLSCSKEWDTLSQEAQVATVARDPIKTIMLTGAGTMAKLGTRRDGKLAPTHEVTHLVKRPSDLGLFSLDGAFDDFHNIGAVARNINWRHITLNFVPTAGMLVSNL